MDMGSKIKAYLAALREMLESGKEIENPEGLKRELLREIQFWQHERLIHLIVVVLFALVTIAVLLVMVFYASIGLLLLLLMLLVLLVPYIWHYYKLENGVQTLYAVYEEVCRRTLEKDIPGECIPEEYGIKIKPFKKES